MQPAESPASEARYLRHFLVMWTGQAFSLLGSQLVQFGLAWYLARQTGSPTVLTTATLAAILPQIVIGPFAGPLVDRWSRKRVMAAADGLIAAATVGLMVLFWTERVATWHIYALLVVRGAGGAFHWPAMQASTSMMVPTRHLARIGGMNQVLAGMGSIAIPPLGALAVELLPMQGVLAIDVLTAVPAIGSLLLVTVPQPVRELAGSGVRAVLEDLRFGVAYVWKWKALLAMAAVGITIYIMARPAGALSPLLVMQHFGGGAAELGWWEAAAGSGVVAGGVLLGIWGGFRSKVKTQMLFLALDGVVIMLIGLCPGEWFIPALGLMFTMGLLEAVVVGLSGAIFQTLVPPNVQGRVFSLLTSVSLASAPLGLVIAGPFTQAFGLPLWWVLTGFIFSATAAAVLVTPAVSNIETRPAPA